MRSWELERLQRSQRASGGEQDSFCCIFWPIASCAVQVRALHRWEHSTGEGHLNGGGRVTLQRSEKLKTISVRSSRTWWSQGARTNAQSSLGGTMSWNASEVWEMVFRGSCLVFVWDLQLSHSLREGSYKNCKLSTGLERHVGTGSWVRRNSPLCFSGTCFEWVNGNLAILRLVF